MLSHESVSNEEIKQSISIKTNRFNLVASQIEERDLKFSCATKDIYFDEWNEQVVRLYKMQQGSYISGDKAPVKSFWHFFSLYDAQEIMRYSADRITSYLMPAICSLFAFLLSAWSVGLPLNIAFFYSLKYGFFVFAAGVTAIVVFYMVSEARIRSKSILQKIMWLMAAFVLSYEIYLLVEIVFKQGR